jgi:hypothetical protein
MNHPALLAVSAFAALYLVLRVIRGVVKVLEKAVVVAVGVAPLGDSPEVREGAQRLFEAFMHVLTL